MDRERERGPEPEVGAQPGSEPEPSRAPEPGVEEERPPERPRDVGRIVKLSVAAILIVLFLVFVVQNSADVEVHFIFTRARVPLVWVFLVCALVGGLVAFLLGRPRRRATQRYIRELERWRGDRRGS